MFKLKRVILRAEQSRCTGLDILKTVAAFLIVCIHAPFPGVIGEYYIALTRIAVPIFFMITGFFYSDTQKRNREGKQIKKIFLLVIEANALYFIWNIASVMGTGSILEYFKTVFSILSMAKFILLNQSPFNGHLWYLGALLYVLITVYLLNKFLSKDKVRILLYVMVPFLLLGDLILGKYSLLIFGREFPYILVRNFIFVGLPYFTVGNFIRERKENINLSRKMLWVLTVLFILTTLLERFLLVSIHANATRDHYISTTLLAIVILALLMEDRWNKYSDGIMARSGREYSNWVYIVHPIFITITGMVIKKIGLECIYEYVQPIVVYFASVIFVAVICTVKKKIHWVKS